MSALTALFGPILSRFFGYIITLFAGVIAGVLIAVRIAIPDPVDAQSAIRVEVIHSNEETAKAEVVLEEKREAIRQQIKYVTKEVVKYVPATEVVSGCTLTVGAVSLLNAARTGTDFQPAPDIDAQIKAATDIGLRELSQADIELARQYRELAADHDALVEYAEQFKRRQQQAAE